MGGNANFKTSHLHLEPLRSKLTPPLYILFGNHHSKKLISSTGDHAWWCSALIRPKGGSDRQRRLHRIAVCLSALPSILFVGA